MNALLVVLFNKGIKLSPLAVAERLQELKDELGDYLYIAQLDVRNRAAIEEMLASLPAEWCNIDIPVIMPARRWAWSLHIKPALKTGKR